MTALIVTVSCSDGEPLTDERRDEIRASFTGAAKRIGIDVQSVHVDGGATVISGPASTVISGPASDDDPVFAATGEYDPATGVLKHYAESLSRDEFDNKASARTLADRAPHSVTEWHYEQASWDRRHGRV